MIKKKDIKNLTRNKLINWFKKRDLPGFRGKQVFNWLYKNNVNSFAEMKNLPDNIIRLLEEYFFINSLQELKKQHADDGTIKFLWGLNDGCSVESVYLPFLEKNRHSVCISSQAGCALACKFCATGQQGLKRDLKTAEIVEQVLKMQEKISTEEFGKPRISNIVFMGMGEPLSNITAVLTAIDIFNDQQGLNIGQRKITVSTAGLVPGIIKIAQMKLQIGLAVSLNAPDNKLRSKIMPVNNSYPLEELLAAVEYYIEETGRRVTFEYILIKDVNDSPRRAFQVNKLLKNLNCHINLIALNESGQEEFSAPSREKINAFARILKKQGQQVTIRESRGEEIDAACGQLSAKK